MKQKVVASLVSAAMVATLFAGCGSSSTATSSASKADSSSAAASSAASSSAEDTAAASSSSAAEESTSSASSEAVEATSTASTSASSSSDDSGWTNLDQFDGLKANEAYEFPIIVKCVTYTAQGPNSESDIADQVNMLNSAISSSPKGIGLAACDTSSVLDSLQTCADKGIPVVAFDTGIADAPEGSMACTVVTDNTAAGATAADGMWEAIEDKVKNADGQVRIGEVSQDATALNIQQRTLGFVNEMIKLIQKDGKLVDHLYTYPGLIEADEEQRTYYIGDSKYYKLGAKLGDTSIYKQYTYARNIVQYNIDLWLDETQPNPEVRLRDDLTEGYNIIPNFFISAAMKPGDYSYNHSEIELTQTGNKNPEIK